MSDVPDWELAARAKSGDWDAFGELVRRYQKPVLNFCRRMVGSTEDAEDIAQESFIRVYRCLDRLEPRAKFSTLLFGIARNLALNAIRDAARHGHGKGAPSAVFDETARVAENRAAQPDQAARLHETESLLEQALMRLSPEHREILLLRETEGLDYETIAQVIRCRKGTVRSRLARAREQLRLRFIEMGGEL